jgi:hypothetical protein
MCVPRIVLATILCAAAAACGGDSDGMIDPPPPPPPSDVASVTVTGPATQVVPRDEIQLVATARDASGTVLSDRPVAWSSSSEAVALVSESGLVTAVAPGSVMITATSEEQSGTLGLTVGEGGRIGADGGTVSALGGSVRLEVPAGAVASPVSITVQPAGQLPRDPSVVVGSGYVLGPAGTSFASAAQLTLPYSSGQGPSGVPESDFRVHRLDAGGLQSLGGEVDAGAHVATAPVTELGNFVVGRAPAETPCTQPEHRQFDFWVGQWNVTAVGQPADRPTPSDITLEPGGCAVFEDFGNGAGRSVNVYSSADGHWHQTFVFSGGQRLVLIGGLEGSAMVLSRRFPGAPAGSFDRWTWTQLSEGRVRQLQEVSTDGGQTVTPLFDGTYVPR